MQSFLWQPGFAYLKNIGGGQLAGFVTEDIISQVWGLEFESQYSYHKLVIVSNLRTADRDLKSTLTNKNRIDSKLQIK